MTNDVAAIVRQIERLDHPDVHLQDAALAQLSRRPDKARPVVLERFPEVNARVRRALLRWLIEEASPEVTLPLMRYVFDEADSAAEQSGRSMAMAILWRRAQKTTLPEERGRLRAFAEDMCSDDNPEVRRLAVRILTYVGNRRSQTQVELRLRDDDSEVRDAARRAMDALADAPGPDDEPEDAPGELRQKLLHSAGPRRRHLVRRWREHSQRADIALELLRRGGELRSEALQILVEEPRPKARPYLASMVLDDPEGDLAPLAIRVLARIAADTDEGPRPDEERALRIALESKAMLTCAAACAAVGAFGLKDHARRLIALAESRHLPVALEAAKSLDGLLDHRHDEWLEYLLAALRTNERRRRRHHRDRDCIRIVAHLLSALRDVISPSTIGVERLHRVVFDILAAGGTHRPLQVTGLQVLLASTAPEGVESIRRWTDEQVAILIDLLDRSERQAMRRIATLLWRAAPRGAYRLDEAAQWLWKSDAVDVADIVVPLLDRADTDKALKLLSQIADGQDPSASRAARDVLRRRRNERDVIDVEFSPRDSGD